MAIFGKKQPDSTPARRRMAAPTDDELATPRRSVTFRRNRTLTGSSSPVVSSSNELDAELRSPRAHVHHLNRRRRHIMRRFAVTLLACAGLYMLISQFIAEVSISSNMSAVVISEVKKAEYARTVNDYFGGHPAERLKFYLNTSGLQDYVVAKHPEVASLTLDQTAEIGRAVVSVRLREPVARWTVGGSEDFVDTDGVVFGYSPYPRPEIEIINTNIAAGLSSDVAVGHQFLGFVGQVVGEAKKQGFTVTKATIPLLTIRQLEINMSGVGYPVKMTTDRLAGEQVEDMARVVRYLGQRNITPQYVDVRVEGKAFYK